MLEILFPKREAIDSDSINITTACANGNYTNCCTGSATSTKA